MNYIIENEFLHVAASTHGAELMCIYDKKRGQEYLWNGNAEFWGRRSPVLFPFVGAVKDKQYKYKGKTYPMGQHGFARDMEFVKMMPQKSKEEMWFELKSNQETLAKYPFEFSLQIGYRLEGKSIKIMWRVCNLGKENMHFSIGAHPAFLCPIDSVPRNEYYLYLDGIKKEAELSVIDATCGLIGNTEVFTGFEEAEQGSYVKIADNLFDKDALILENHQTQKVSLCKPDKTPYITVKFDAPLVGIWSPAGKLAPFVCIEPWYGRCDKNDFNGELEDREWGNTLGSTESFETSYSIIIE